VGNSTEDTQLTRTDEGGTDLREGIWEFVRNVERVLMSAT